MRASVAIASFNGEKYIEKQLESILNQTMLPYEIIISDDGSQDNTVPVIQQFIESRRESITQGAVHIRVIVNNGRHGVCGNFENAFMHTTGDVVFLCDQDDIWFPEKIEKVLYIMEKRPENVLLHDAEAFKEENGKMMMLNYRLMKLAKPEGESVWKLDRSDYLPSVFNYCIIQGMCICIRREYLMKILPICKAANHDDWILFCACADNSLIVLNESLAYYRIHGSNTVGISEYKKKRSIIKKLETFDMQGKKSIRGRYIWFKDTISYTGECPNDEIKQRYEFFTKRRIEYLSGRKILSTLNLLRADKRGVYKRDGKITLIHDLYFLWRYSRRYRVQFMSNLDEELRANSVI